MRAIPAVARRALLPLIPATLFLAALWVIRGELGEYPVASVRAAIAGPAVAPIVLALLLTALDYVALTTYEVRGLRYAGQELPLRRVALASTTGYAFSQALGFPLLTGAPIRYRLYSSWGIDGLDIARVVAFCTVTFWLGLFSFGGAALLVSPPQLPTGLGIPLLTARPLGGLMVLVALAYVAWCARTRRPLRFRGLSFEVPSARVAALQIALGGTEWLLSAGVLWALLPPELGLAPGEAISLYVMASAAGLISNVPGGVGVFEAVVLWYLPSTVYQPQLLGALLLYRIVFYLVPLLIGAVLLAVSEFRANRAAARELFEVTLRTVSPIAPRVISALTFITGAVLLFGGALPFAEGSRRWLTRVVPLPVFELSHFAASLVGAGLLILARGLQRRLDGAYQVTLVVVVIGALAAVGRGLAPLELVLLVVLLGVLFVSRPEFYRKASLVSESFNVGWVVAIGLVVVTSIWLGTFAYARVEYASDLWWRFAIGGNASRFLRSAVGVATLVGLFAVARLLRPAPVVHVDADDAVLTRITPIVSANPRVSARLALVGDKQILLSDSGRAFLMFGIEGDSWISMGDPVGDPSEFRALAWRFRELADRAGDTPAFYQVSQHHLSLYIELGLTLLKIGEEAFVDLPTSSFEGSRRADFRKALRRLEEAGGSFEVVQSAEVEPMLPQLESISDSWLAKWNATEKRFSMGSFNHEYMLRNPVGVVRVEGTPVAFGNIWIGGSQELSYDMIRYSPDAPKTTMDYMFAQLILWGREAGFQRMALGMAPLSGLDSDRLASAWSLVGTAVFRYGGHFYNFQGLRAYKEKFDPVWEPRYLACPAGLALPGSLSDVVALIAGGVKGIGLK